MLKLIGAVLVLFAGTMMGFYKSVQLANRPLQIRRCIHALQQLETEIMYGFTPLPDALATVSKRAGEPVRTLFQLVVERLAREEGLTFQECWHTSVAEFWNRTAMRSGEKEILDRLGMTLGISDREDQFKHLHLAVNQLQSEEVNADEDRKRYEKMWKSLGILVGALVVILMY